MLVIRQQQFAALGMARDVKLEPEFARHLQTHFPAAFAAMDADELSRYVRRGLEKARSYGLDSPRDFFRFLNLCAAYGADFDAERRHSWMREALLDAAVTSPSDRLRLLTAECIRRARIAAANESRRRRFLEKT